MRAWTHGDPDVVVRGILASAPYRHAATEAVVPPKKTWADAVWAWIVDHVKAFVQAVFGPIGHSLDATQNIWKTLSIVIVVLAVIALVFVVYRLIVALVRPPALAVGHARSGAVALVQARSSRAWRDAARAAAAQRDYRQAIAALFSAALAMLDERSLVAFDPARTPGEYARLVRRVRAPAAEPFGELSGRFVRAAYAEVAVDESDYEASERAYARFEPATEELT
jgi:hypothetical protein